jgi:hypothetical protein
MQKPPLQNHWWHEKLTQLIHGNNNQGEVVQKRGVTLFVQIHKATAALAGIACPEYSLSSDCEKLTAIVQSKTSLQELPNIMLSFDIILLL